MASESLYYIWLSCALGYASVAVKPLLERFGDAYEIYSASEEEYAEVKALCAPERKNLLNKDLTRASEIAEYCLHAQVRLLKFTDPDYPEALRAIPNPPVLLYCRGRIPDWNRLPCIGVVGTRAMSYYGADAACEISYDLGRMGCITVSGMALGIDGVVAAATLESGGTTVAVLGSGIDRIYPKEHRSLYQAIVDNGGAVITEFAPNEGADAFHFPLRNRIISGLSCALILVEGEVTSGALITARYAKKQGKCVFAVPGKINDKNSEAPHLLLKQQAKPLTCADDVYDNFKAEYFSSINPFALLPKVSLSVEDVIRKYGIASGKTKSREKKLLNTAREKENTAGKMLKKLRGLFGNEESSSQEVNAETENNPRQNEQNCQKQLDDERKARLSPRSYAVYEKLSYENALHPDEINVDGLSIDMIAAELITMEVMGAVTLAPGGCYLKNKN